MIWDSAIDETLRLVQLLVSLATFVTLAWGLAKMFKSAAEAKATRAEAVAASARAEGAALAAATEVRAMSDNVQKIETATNSMKDALILATAASSKLEGREEMRIEQAAKGARNDGGG